MPILSRKDSVEVNGNHALVNTDLCLIILYSHQISYLHLIAYVIFPSLALPLLGKD